MEEKHHREKREREREKKGTINSSAVDSRPFAADRLAGGLHFVEIISPYRQWATVNILLNPSQTARVCVCALCNSCSCFVKGTHIHRADEPIGTPAKKAELM
jgi:hypothetical protein